MDIDDRTRALEILMQPSPGPADITNQVTHSGRASTGKQGKQFISDSLGYWNWKPLNISDSVHLMDWDCDVAVALAAPLQNTACRRLMMTEVES